MNEAEQKLDKLERGVTRNNSQKMVASVGTYLGKIQEAKR